MPSTYSSLLRVELPANGEQSNTWGTTLNTQLGTVLEQAIAGRASVAVTDGADTTLTTANGSTDQARCMALNLTGTLTAARNVICPSSSKLYVVQNNTSGGYAVTLKTSAGTGVSVSAGDSLILYCDGTNVVQVSASNDAILTAIEALSDTGVITRTGSGTVAARTITAGTGISVTNGNGVSGNPTIANSGVTAITAGSGVTIDQTTGTVTITATGTSTSSWGAGSATNPGWPITGDLDTGLYSPGADQIGFATGGSARTVLDSTGKWTFQASGVAAASLNVPHGNAPTTPVNGDVWTTTSGLFSRVNGATKTIAFTDSNISGTAGGLTSTLTVSGGGTGATTLTGVLKGNGTSAFTAAVAGTDYQAPIGTITGVAKGNGANALTAATAGTDYAKPDTASSWTAEQTFKEVTETVYTVSGTTPALDPANGTVQVWTLTGNSTPTSNLAAGQSITLMIADGTAYTITWTSILAAGNWIGGSAPTLPTTGYAVITLWKVSTTVYGAYLGDLA